MRHIRRLRAVDAEVSLAELSCGHEAPAYADASGRFPSRLWCLKCPGVVEPDPPRAIVLARVIPAPKHGLGVCDRCARWIVAGEQACAERQDDGSVWVVHSPACPGSDK